MLFTVKLLLLTVILNLSYCLSSLASGKPINFRKIAMDEGLPDASIQAFYQDDLGYMWIGTRNGLARYDGDEILIFGKEQGLENSFIFHLTGYPNDSLLWVASREGLYTFNTLSEQFTLVPLLKGQQPTVFRTILYRNQKWVTTNSGLFLIEDNSVTHYRADDNDLFSISDNYVLSALPLGDSLLIGTEYGLNMLDVNSGRFYSKKNRPDSWLSETDDFIQFIYQRKNGEIWLSAFRDEEGGGLHRILPDGKIETYFNKADDENSLMYNYAVLTFEEDIDGNLWIGSNGAGISIFNDEEQSFVNIRHDRKNPDGLSDPDVWSIFKDRTGLMWIGTDGGSINLYHPSYDRFQIIRNNPFDNSTINADQILSTTVDDQYLWLGTNSSTGLISIDLEDGGIYNFPFNKDYTRSLYDNTVYALESIGDYLWVGTNAGGLSRLDKRSNTFEHFFEDTSQDENTWRYNYILSLEADEDWLYLGTLGGLDRINQKTLKREHLKNYAEIGGGAIIYMVAHEGILWLCTEKNLMQYDLASQSLLEPDNKFLNKRINYLLHGQSAMWLGTNEGLIKSDQGGLRTYTIADGLSSNVIQSLAEDSYGRIWVATKNGLNMLDAASDHIVQFNSQDGISDNYFNLAAVCQDSQGNLYFGTNSGITQFQPDQISLLEFHESPVLKHIEFLGDDSVRKISLLELQEMEINYNANTFTVDFFVPNYIHPQKMNFRYQIGREERNTIDLGTTSKIQFADLSSGNQALNISAQNRDGVTSPKSASIMLRILPPWWLSNTAYFIYAIMVLGLILLRDRYIKAEKKRLEKIVIDRTATINEQKEKAIEDKNLIAAQSEKLKEMDTLKTRFFSNISHEFRTPLTLIQGPVDAIYHKRINTPEAIDRNLSIARKSIETLRNLIDEILEFNKIEAGTAKIPFIPINFKSFIEERLPAYQQLAEDAGLSFRLQSSDIPERRIMLPADKIKHIINNLLSNAVKHGPNGSTVTLSVSVDQEMLEIAVSDQGVGISEEEKSKVFDEFYQTQYGKQFPHSSGIGLAYVKELTEALNGSIHIESEPGEGTTFRFLMKIKYFDGVERMRSEESYTDDIPEILKSEYPHPNKRILIVEDNKEMSDYLFEVLNGQFEIQTAEDGVAALEMLKEFDANAIISDLMMPRMGGLELLKHVKNDPKLRLKCFLILTAKTSHETKIEALAFGIDDYLTKPFSPIELEVRVRNLLNNQYQRSLALSAEEDNESQSPLIKDLIKVIESNIENPDFGVIDLSEEAALSDRQLTRLLKKSVGMTPALLIKEVKLQKAKLLLEQKTFRSVAEVSHAVGMNKPSYFSKIYLDRFGRKPSEYLN